MYKVIGSRGTGLTSAMMRKAEYLINKHPNKKVVFICRQPETIKGLYNQYGFKYGEKILFLSFQEGKDVEADYKIIDGLDNFLTLLNVFGYSISTGENDYSFLED